METRRIRESNQLVPDKAARHGVRERVARVFSPMGTGPFVRLWISRYWRLVLVLLGLVVELVLMFMVWQLVELCISLMEVWAELARKHLEITLS